MKPIHTATTAWQPGAEFASIESLPPEDCEILSQLMEEYLAGLETGFAPDVERMLNEHPHLRQPLCTYVESLQLLHRATSLVTGVEKPGTDAQPLPIERTLGDYRLIREIGRGGMGIVYEAWQVSLDRRVALKVLPFAAVLTPKYLARFQNEVRAAAQLLHPHIVPVFGVGCDRGVHYYSMQFIDGQPLDQAIQYLARAMRLPASDKTSPEKSPSSPTGTPQTADTKNFSTVRSINSRNYVCSVAGLGLQAAQALQHAHEYGVLHRDVKPSNLLIDRLGQLWVTDFGLARIQAGADITVTGDLLGTVRYMSPEQATGKHALVDQRTDVYSLGATLYEMLTLRPAFPESDAHVVLRQIEHDDPIAPRRLNSAVPSDLETIVLKAMSKSRDDRYATAKDFADDLQRFLDGRPTLARQPSIWDRGARWAARHRHTAVAAVAILLISLVVTSVSAVLLMWKEQEAVVAREQAELHLATAKEVVDHFGAEMTEQLAIIPEAAAVRSAMLEETLRFYEDLSQYAAHDPHMRRDLAIAAFKAAGAAQQLGRRDRAVELYERANREFAQFDADDETRFTRALCHSRLAQLLAATENTARAEVLWGEAIPVLEFMSSQSVDSRYIRELATAHNNFGRCLLDQNRNAEAESKFRLAQRRLEDLVNRSTDDAELCISLGGVLNNLGLALEQQGRLEEAASVLAKAIERQQQAIANAPGSELGRGFLEKHYANRARVLRDLGQHEEAERMVRCLDELRNPAGIPVTAGTNPNGNTS